jgi:hypothetical protein
MGAAAADFSRSKEAAGETKEEDGCTATAVKSISLAADIVDFERFVFPGNADFLYANFESATFTGNVYRQRCAEAVLRPEDLPLRLRPA